MSVARWTGSGWASTSTRISSGGNITTDAIDIQYVQAGTYADDIVAVWGQGQYLYSAIFRNNLGSWAANTQVADLGSGNTVKWLKLKPQPDGDDLILAVGATVSAADSLYTIPYDGDTRAWGSLSSAHTTALYGSSDNNRPFDVVWDPDSGSNNTLLVYSDTTELRYKTSSNGGGSWNSQQTLSASHLAYWVQLERDPSDDTIHLAIHDGDDDLNTWTWASATWTFENEINTDLEQSTSRSAEVIALTAYSPSGGGGGGNSAPTLNVDEPDGTGDTVTVGDNYNIQYDLADSDDTVTVAFYYDSDSSGLDGTSITGACATGAEGTNVTCSWDTTGVTPGSYYVYGITDDGTNPQVSDYSSGQITINAGGSSSFDPVIVYSRADAALNKNVYYSEYESSSWTSASLLGTDPDTGDWNQHDKIVRVNPAGTEAVSVWANYNQGSGRDDLMGSIFDGTGWTDGAGGGPVKDFGNWPFQRGGRRPFDAAFMQESGRLMVVSGYPSISEAIHSWIWDGNNTWETGSSYVQHDAEIFNNGDTPHWLSLSARPGTDQVVLVAAMANSPETSASIRGAVWDGNVGTSDIWPFAGTVTGSWSNKLRFVDSTAVRISTEAVGVAHVQTGSHAGDAVVVWGQGQYLYYRIYQADTKSWSSSNLEAWDLGSGNLVKWIRIKPQPDGDDIILAIGDTTSGTDYLRTMRYDGDTRSWGSPSAALSSSLQGSLDYNRPFDIAWDIGSDSDDVLLVYSDTSGLRYRTSTDGGANWNSQQTVEALYQAYWLQLERNPSDDTIHLPIHDTYDDLVTWSWDGSWTIENEINTDLVPTANHASEVIAIGTYPLDGTGNSVPALTVDEPDGSGDTVTVGNSYNIQYDLSDPDDVVTVAFYYDDDNSGAGRYCHHRCMRNGCRRNRCHLQLGHHRCDARNILYLWPHQRWHQSSGKRLFIRSDHDQRGNRFSHILLGWNANGGALFRQCLGVRWNADTGQ